MTIPVFILNTGRAGSLAVTRALNMLDGVEAVHQYNSDNIQAAGTLRVGRLDWRDEQITKILRLVYTRPIYSQSPIWIDCSNKLPWVSDLLFEIFPRAKFVHLTRDGRRVCSSYFHKFDYYSDELVIKTREHLKNAEYGISEKINEAEWFPLFGGLIPELLDISRWGRLCFHWRKSNYFSLLTLQRVPLENQFTVKLEDLTTRREWFARLCEFIGAEFSDEAFASLEKPHNVVEPVSHPLTTEQSAQYKEICGAMHERLGYTWEEVYQVEYCLQSV